MFLPTAINMLTMFSKYNQWPVERFVFSLPEEFTLEHSISENESLQWGPSELGSIHTEQRIWRTKDGAELWLNIWAPTAPRAGGPMQTAAEWPVRIAGIDARIVETKMFEGTYKRVLVVFASLEQPTARFRLLAQGIDVERLKDLLVRVGKQS